MQFPDTLSRLIIDKRKGNLKLSRNLHITDSLILKRGNLISSDSCKISFYGQLILPNEFINNITSASYMGFIEGPINYYTDSTTEVFFPIGKDGIYAPISIIKDTALPMSYCIEYFKGKSNKYDSTKTYPLYKIDSSQYWKMGYIDPGSTVKIKSSINLYSNLNKIENRYNEQCLAYYNQETNTWNNINLSPHPEETGIQISSEFILNEGLFTFGKIRFDALNSSVFNTNAQFIDNEVEVIWFYEKNPEIIHYRIEISKDSKKFDPVGIIKNHNHNENDLYKFKFIPLEYTSLYIRLCAIDSFYRPSYSNIVYLKKYFQVKPLFPNPATNEIYLIVNNYDGEKIEHSIIDINGRRIKPMSYRRGNIFIFRIEDLVPGKYVLQQESKDIYKSYAFIKK